MDLDSISLLAALALGIALATDRLLVTIKSAIPVLDGEWKERENIRRLIVQVLAFLISWTAATYIGEGGPFGEIVLTDQVGMPCIIVGLLGSGGSALWKDVLNWTNAVKDLRKESLAQLRAGGSEG